MRSVARVNGMPRARAVFVPQPVMGKSAAELRAYVDGHDPVTGRPVMQEVIEGLTRPWEPFQVSKGFRSSESTVSAFGGCRHTAFTLGLREAHWKDHVRNMLRGMDPREHPLFVLDPITARLFIDRGGFDTRDKLIDWAYDNACMTAGEYWDYQLIQNYIYPRATYGEEPYASMLATPADEMVHMFKRDEIEVVVGGGETNGYWRIFGANCGKTVSVDDWR